ncbi:glycoside hydrolase [Penicillium canescens]|nr:glycoside hydrolase [Penicillium canescens]
MGPLSLAKALALLPLLVNLVVAEDAKGTSGSCSKDSKCVSGCCSNSGYCGFGPDFCDDDVCMSGCDAKAECGPYAQVANTTCPLNVCCSQYGFCGTTDEFCGDGCISGCDAVDQPSCSGTSTEKVYGGYFEAWNYEHSCDNLEPKNIDVKPWTDLFYSFAGIVSDDSSIEMTYDKDDEWIPQMVALKKKKPSLKVWLSVGGWALGGQIFSDMVRFKGTRKAFINSAIETMGSWGFDGIDIDWEYPAASDRDGRKEDTANFVTFMKELKEACGEKYGISATLPSSYYYLKGFDVKGMADYVDHYNFMSYDIHGTWDGNSAWTSSVINPHTNLTEISEGLNLLWRNDVDPAKVNLGLAFYGRSFTLKDSSCDTPGCAFDTTDNANGGGMAGLCTSSSGILSDYEIDDVLEMYEPDVIYDEEAAVNWITWNTDQWVSFDNARSLKQKAEFANSRCLGGLFAWALDQGGPASVKNPNQLNSSDTSMSGADLDGGNGGSGDVYIADSVADPKSNTATGIAPLNMVIAPSTLSSATTFSIEPITTAIEVAWTTTTTVTVSGQPTVTSTIARTVQTTTFTVPAVTVSVIPWWNWNITGTDVTKTSTTLFPSITLDPITFRNDGNPESITNGTFATHTVTNDRTFFPPPWPWSTTSLPVKVPTPTVTYTQGPPGPTCTANCGTKCDFFCDSPCLDCNDPQSSKNWEDPEDPNPPSHSTCTGADCKGGECTGSLCVKKGCKGADCVSGVCVGSRCQETGCIGDDCTSGGSCDGDDCKTIGCEGDDCDSGGSGICFGLQCISIGCIGPLCSSKTGECTGRDCTKVSCSGANCRNGQCTGAGCKSEDKDCEAEKADVCTESVYSTIVTPASTYTTETSTQCETITACSAKATTTTTTVEESDIYVGTMYPHPVDALDTAVASHIALSMELLFTSMYDPTSTTSTSISTTTTKDPTTTTTEASPTKTQDWSKYEPKVTVKCGGTSQNIHGTEQYAQCDKSCKLIVDTDVYSSDDGDNAGECEKTSSLTSCKIAVEGYDVSCSISGESMKSAYDAIRKSCGTEFGRAQWGDCQVSMEGVYSTSCSTKSKGGKDMTNPDNWD